MNDPFVKNFVASMSDEELCAEVLSWGFGGEMSNEDILKMIQKNKISCIFADPAMSPEQLEFAREAIKKYSKSPCLVTADIERGPAFYPELEQQYATSMMNLGAADDEELAFNIGKYTARLCRARGLHLALAPVVDISYNYNSPIVNARAAGDDPDLVIRTAGAYGRGMRSEGYLATTIKHFPGDGVDDRNQHFCTTVNSLSKEEWMATYGRVWREMIAQGTEAIMAAHIALPWFDPHKDDCGLMPATLSKPLMTDLLKGELGFEGCIVSDAMGMIGTSARMAIEDLSIEFLRAGGDLVLFPEKDDLPRILDALHSGYLPRERLIDAAERVVALKKKLGLFEGREYSLTEDDVEQTKKYLSEVAKKSITLVRNLDGVLPLKLEKGAKVLVITLAKGGKFGADSFPALADALEARGFETIRITNPSHYKVNELIDTVDAVFLNSIIDTDTGTGNSLRLHWSCMMTFWRGYVFKNKNLVFVSFGDPYKLYEMPFLKTYINAYIVSATAANAVLDACFGEAEFPGKSPVKIPEIDR